MPLGTNTNQSKRKQTAKVSDGKTSAKKEDAIKLLMADHDEVEALFKQYEKAKDIPDEKSDIAGQICKFLTVHATIEEEIFYPAARDALGEKGEDMLDEAEVEHASAKWLIGQLEDGDQEDELFDAKVKVLSEYIQHHVKEEEEEMFPKIRKTDLDLADLGAQLAERKAELMDEENSEDEEGVEDQK